ncbi:MAG: glutathione-disulfide reductase [Hyphomonadaceae bacterium]|nr:glutathione-disulfide reductase [Hyphomonadaceae bacterium]MBC6412490.1 glutathione-disulfide reductase [Hyphomonadaceae bacterium]
MSNYDYDLFVIGAGSGGVRAGRLAARLGKRVAVAEESRPGGTCVVRGCVPKKLLVYGSQYGEAIKSSGEYGWSVKDVSFDWTSLRGNVQEEVSRLSGIYGTMLERSGVTVFSDRAEFVDAHTLKLQISGREVTAETILIAVGGRPWVPDIRGAEHAVVSDDAFLLENLPEKILIIGGGYIASEFAGIFAGMGVKTVQAYRGERLLRGFDPDVRECVGRHQMLAGIDVRFNISPTEISKSSGEYTVTFGDRCKITTDLVFMATGRRPHTAGLGLDRAGVDVDENGAVAVDAYSRTSAGHIYAIGDVTDRVNLTPVAIREGMAFVETVFGKNRIAYDHSNIPSAVFTQPPVGVVGLTEPEARQKHGDDITVYTTKFRPMKNILAHKEQQCLMKLITLGEDETVIGIHLVGDDTPEIIQALGICIKGGLTKADFDSTCAVHPTSAEEIVTLKSAD